MHLNFFPLITKSYKLQTLQIFTFCLFFFLKNIFFYVLKYCVIISRRLGGRKLLGVLQGQGVVL